MYFFMITGAFFYEFYRIFHMNVERNDLFSILGHEIFVIIYNWSKIVTHSSQIPSIDCFSSFLTSGVILMKLLFFLFLLRFQWMARSLVA